jgi:hypothetical protein
MSWVFNPFTNKLDWAGSGSGGSGTVTSVALSTPNFLSVSGSPITTSGTLALSYSGTALPLANGGTGATTLAGASIVTYSGAETLTSKRINPRVSTTASSAAAVTPDISAYDQYNWTAQAAALTINAPTGTPVDGNKLMFRILDNGTARALDLTAYTAIGVTLPTTTVANKTTYVGAVYNANNTRWDVIAVTTQA